MRGRILFLNLHLFLRMSAVIPDLKKVCEPESLSSISVLSIELIKNTSSLHDLDNIFKKYVSNVVGCY